MSKQYAADDDFLITDPEKQPGVILDLPAGVAPLGLREEGYYAEAMVRCSFCRQRQRHRRGYFAVLPDGSLALCGHCCAVALTSKATVARIDRRVDTQIAAAEHRTISGAIVRNVPEILALIDRDFLALEREVNETSCEISTLFPGWYRRAVPRLGVARGGLVAMLNEAGGKLTDRKVEELLKKRQLVFQAIREGLELLKEGADFIDLDRIRGLYRHHAHRCKYQEASLKGRVLTAGGCFYHLGEYDYWTFELEIPEITVPDTTELLELLDA
jgi:hypothetical protein